MIKKLKASDFPSSYLEAELESRNSNRARGVLRAMSDEEIIQELEDRRKRSIQNWPILRTFFKYMNY